MLAVIALLSAFYYQPWFQSYLAKDSDQIVSLSSEEVSQKSPLSLPGIPGPSEVMEIEETLSEKKSKDDFRSELAALGKKISPQLAVESKEVRATEDKLDSLRKSLIDEPGARERIRRSVTRYIEEDTAEIIVNTNSGAGTIEDRFNPDKSTFVPGARGGRRGSLLSGEEVIEEEEEEEEEVDAIFYEGQARGYAMLNLMLPSARQTVERQLEIMVASRVRQVYLGVLVDGTFGDDFGYLERVLRRFDELGRSMILALYLTNGPAIRNDGDEGSLFGGLEPLEFRELIKNDPVTRDRFLRVVRSVRPVFELNQSLNSENENIAVVMLEDNLREDSYRAMRDLARFELGDLVQFYRNPCLGCFTGNDSFSHGDMIELHSPESILGLRPDDGFTLDGVGFRFDNESPDIALRIENLLSIQRTTLDRGIKYFGLWRKERQGLGLSGFIPVDERTFEVPTEEQMIIEAEILRDGLEPIIDADADISTEPS